MVMYNIYIYTQCGLIPLFSSLLAAVAIAVDVAADNTTTDVGLVLVQMQASTLKGLDVQYTKDAGACEDANGKLPTYFMSGSTDYTVATCQSRCDLESWCGAFQYGKSSGFEGRCILFSSVSGAATVDDKPSGFLYSYGSSDPVVGGGQAPDLFDCYYKPEQAPESTPTPTLAPTDGGMSGDPHVTFNGTRSTIHLPTQKYTKLVEQSGVAILAKGGPDEEASDNWIFSVAVFENGQEKARLDQALGNLSARDALMNLVVGNVTSHPKRVVTTLGKSLRMTSAREKVVFLHEPTGLEFVVASRPTTKKAANSHHLNIRFSKGLVSSGVGRATGALPEIWGFQPLSSDVESLILRRNVSRRPKRM